MVLGYMFRPYCGHLQANLYRLRALNLYKLAWKWPRHTLGCANPLGGPKANNSPHLKNKNRLPSKMITKFLGVFAKLQKATNSFVMSVCLPVCQSLRSSVRPHRTTWLQLHGLSRKLIFEYFSKICLKIKVSLKSDNTIGYYKWRPKYVYDNISLNYY